MDSSMSMPEGTSRTTTEITEDVARQFAQYFEVETPTLQQDMSTLGENVDDLLARLDEFQGVVATMRGDAHQLLEVTAPPLLKNCEQLQALFEKIECLERFVSEVKKNYQSIEAEVAEQERQKRSFLPRLFKSVLSQSKPDEQSPKGPLEVIKTADYFPSTQ